MEKIRVLVANRPHLMWELVLATISDQTDIEVMGEINDDSEITGMVEESRLDFVIVALIHRRKDRPFATICWAEPAHEDPCFSAGAQSQHIFLRAADLLCTD